MFTKQLPSLAKFGEILVIGLILSTGVLVYFTPSYLPVKLGVNYAPQFMLAYFFIGLLFLVFNKPKLMFSSFACSAALGLFLKSNTYGAIMYPTPSDQPKVSVAHFNTINFDNDYQATLDLILDVDADLVSVQELTLDWDEELENGLSEVYPFNKTIPDLGINGMAIYSKHPFSNIDTFQFKGIPNIMGTIQLDQNESVNFISSHTTPALTTADYFEMKAHLVEIANAYAAMNNEPTVVFGDYHAVPWSSEIQTFKNLTGLNDSRIGIAPTYPHGIVDFFESPIDHILFSDHFKCTSFYTLSGDNSKHVGIQGTFELVGESYQDYTNNTIQ